MPDVLHSLLQVFQALGDLVLNLVILAAQWSLLIAWLAWWIFAVNWRRTWAFLAEGAWVPVVLLMLVSALVWSSLDPVPCNCLGAAVPNFWWQLGGVCLLVAVTLFCGWLQGVIGWTPPEISLEPPAHASHDDHGHGHH